MPTKFKSYQKPKLSFPDRMLLVIQNFCQNLLFKVFQTFAIKAKAAGLRHKGCGKTLA
jgi:hypothetical protein